MRTPREEDIIRRLCSGETLIAVGTAYGITRERVRQIFNFCATDEEIEHRYKSKKALRKESPESKAWRALEYGASQPRCAACGGMVMKKKTACVARGTAITCSRKCAEVWRRERYQRSAKFRRMQRICLAKLALKEGRNLVWAENCLKANGEYLKPERSKWEGRSAGAPEDTRWPHKKNAKSFVKEFLAELADKLEELGPEQRTAILAQGAHLLDNAAPRP